jgi:hypothetical protein
LPWLGDAGGQAVAVVLRPGRRWVGFDAVDARQAAAPVANGDNLVVEDIRLHVAGDRESV